MKNEWTKYWLKNEISYKKRILEERLLKKGYSIENIQHYGEKEIISLEQTNAFIIEKITAGEPFMAGRFGATEMRTIISFLAKNYFPFRDMRKKCVTQLCQLSGFFPNDIETGQKFVNRMLEDCSCIDLCGVWGLYMEDYVLKQYASTAELTLIDRLEPWNLRLKDNGRCKPWTSALKGKKVLVIHPFAKTIHAQYNNYREKLFERIYAADDILPPFELITMKAVQTLYGNNDGQYSDWFEALDSMQSKCRTIDFDVAIIGCGAYGFPLAASIKRMGKAAIHLGGVTQILFGIKGRRWESGGYKIMMEQIENKYWCRPSKEEVPENADKVENGCYW